MANRVMEVKIKKLRTQRRRYPRRMDLDRRGSRPSKDMISSYAERTKGIGVDDQIKQHTNPPGRAEIIRRLIESRDNPEEFSLHWLYMDTYVQKIWVWTNSQLNKWRIEQYHKRDKVQRISCMYNNKDDVIFALEQNIVTWILERSLKDQAATGAVSPSSTVEVGRK